MKSPISARTATLRPRPPHPFRAAAELAKNGFTLDESTACQGEKMVAVYLKQEFGGFAVHLLQK